MQNIPSQTIHDTRLPFPMFLFLLFLVMASSSFVMIEPAPVDLGIIFLLALGIMLQTVKFPYENITTGSFFLYFFLVASIISMLGLADPQNGVRDFAITIYLILSWYLFIGVIGRYGETALKALLYGYTVAAMFTAIIGILVYFSVIPWQDTLMVADRVKGLFKDPNVFGPFLIPIALFAYSKIESSQKNNKMMWLMILLTLVVGVFLSYSRAAWGNFVITFLVYIAISFLIRPSFKLVINLVLMAVILTATLMYVLSIPSIGEMFDERFNYQQYDDDRFSNQAVAVKVGFDNPFGIGPGQYIGSIGYATHSTYLRIWAENGIIGFIGFFGFIFATLYRCVKLIIISKNPFFIVFFASAIGVLFNSIVVETHHWRHFWFIFAIPWAFSYKDSKIMLIGSLREKAKLRTK